MGSKWVGFIELFVVLGFLVVWGVLELVGLRLDKQRRERESGNDRSADPPG
jgi:hypothetical protein